MNAGLNKLPAALIAAQAEMPAIKPDGVNPHYRSEFVTLGHLIAKARPVLNKHGLAVSQFPACGEDGCPTLVTIILHESGERLEYVAPLLLSKSDPQGQGSAITYMRRYALAAALGISDQDDDDGEASVEARKTVPTTTAQAKPSERPASAKQRGMLNAVAGERKLKSETLSRILTEVGGVTHLDRLPMAKVDAVKAAIEATKEEA